MRNFIKVYKAALMRNGLIGLAGLLAAFLGLITFTGWVFDIPALRSVLPNAVEMKVNTAIALFCGGSALVILRHRRLLIFQRFAQALAIAVAALGFATLVEYAAGWQLGIDELLFRDTTTAYNAFRGRMSPFTAVAFVSFGLALAALPQPRMRSLVLYAAALVTVIGVTSLLGYAWNTNEVVTDLWLPPVAIHTALGFILLGVGTLLASQAPEWQHAMRPSISSDPMKAKILGGFVGSLVLLFVMGGLTYRTNAGFANASKWVTHAQEVRAALGDLYATISNAEAAQRNYLLTGNGDHKKDYVRFASMLDDKEGTVGRLVVDNVTQVKNLAKLQPLTGQRMAALAKQIDIYETKDMATVQQAIENDEGIRAKRGIQLLVGNMDGLERELWFNRAAALEHSRELTLVMLLATLTLATVILTTLYLAIRRQIAARTDAENAAVTAKEAADSANRAKSTFLATMSHEIRTPMNGLLGMLELLSLTELASEQRNTLEIVRTSSKYLLRIIDDILDFSKIEAGKLNICPEVASIKHVIEDVHNIYSGNASSMGLLIKRIADPSISPAVLIDPVRLRQILNNLVSNALKFTTHGSIEIKAELIGRAHGEDRVRFSVTDTGIGISREDQQRLFQPFSQAEGDQARRSGGTGLGLTICRRLAELMGGSIEMVSELGKGTTMIVIMPLPIADPKDLPRVEFKSANVLPSATTEMHRMAPSIAQAETEGTLVLLVDDHPINRTLLMRQMHALGYAAESAENGAQALDKCKSGRFGLVITDCNMPEMDGYELARSIRRLDIGNGSKRMPIIACTANALAGVAEACFAAGMDDCLVKPAELSQILKKLEQWLPIPKFKNSETDESVSLSPVDRGALAAYSGGDAVIERDILTDFRSVNDKDAILLNQAVAACDIAQVKRATHRILGACRMVGALTLASVCERIELASRASDWAMITVGMEAFRTESLRLNTYFDAL